MSQDFSCERPMYFACNDGQVKSIWNPKLNFLNICFSMKVYRWRKVLESRAIKDYNKNPKQTGDPR